MRSTPGALDVTRSRQTVTQQNREEESGDADGERGVHSGAARPIDPGRILMSSPIIVAFCLARDPVEPIGGPFARPRDRVGGDLTRGFGLPEGRGRGAIGGGADRCLDGQERLVEQPAVDA